MRLYSLNEFFSLSFLRVWRSRTKIATSSANSLPENTLVVSKKEFYSHSDLWAPQHCNLSSVCVYLLQHCTVMSPYPKRKQVVETLVRKGAHLNEKNKELLTPLHIATDLSHYDLMDTLLRLGAKVNVLDALGQTGQEQIILLHQLTIS